LFVIFTDKPDFLRLFYSQEKIVRVDGESSLEGTI